ncbi:hypothetical protein MLD38_001970 [Melastoma candidum]|uniref:Uncharacterized protein n=1 Tax=Melastoma candidum TaxID=119954 RepID=A0ACB9SGX7_9MYRT|nr:hypothetical protein MLD38_001970 [Melastoma candidum]
MITKTCKMGRIHDLNPTSSPQKKKQRKKGQLTAIQSNPTLPFGFGLAPAPPHYHHHYYYSLFLFLILLSAKQKVGNWKGVQSSPPFLILFPLFGSLVKKKGEWE